MVLPFYDPTKTYYENFKKGPFGVFADRKVYKEKGKPTFELLGQKVFLPFGIPAGPLLNAKFVKAALEKGFDIVVYKTVRTRKYLCNPWPNVLSVKVIGDLTPQLAERGVLADSKYDIRHLSITNSFGVPSFSADFWQKDLRDCVRYAKVGQLVIGSFQGTKNSQGDRQKYITDFQEAARLVKETGVKVLEVNLSCPNEGTSNLLCFDTLTCRDVIYAIKKEIGDTPLIIKISYYKDKEQLKIFLAAVGNLVQGIAAINTIPAKILDEKGQPALPGEGRLISGVCGASIKWAGLEMVRWLKKFREELGFTYEIFGVGGVTRVSDYSDYKSAGAAAVLSATGAMWKPYLAQEIKHALKNN